MTRNTEAERQKAKITYMVKEGLKRKWIKEMYKDENGRVYGKGEEPFGEKENTVVIYNPNTDDNKHQLPKKPPNPANNKQTH